VVRITTYKRGSQEVIGHPLVLPPLNKRIYGAEAINIKFWLATLLTAFAGVVDDYRTDLDPIPSTGETCLR
jgi:hypothetical protein